MALAVVAAIAVRADAAVEDSVVPAAELLALETGAAPRGAVDLAKPVGNSSDDFG